MTSDFITKRPTTHVFQLADVHEIATTTALPVGHDLVPGGDVARRLRCVAFGAEAAGRTGSPEFVTASLAVVWS